MGDYTLSPRPAYNDIHPGESRLAWLQRTETIYTWIADPVSGEPIGLSAPDADPYRGHITMLISESQFRLYAAMLEAGVAPVWPGAAHVATSDPVNLVDGLVLAGPMHGVLIEVSSPPAGGGRWPIGDYSEYYNWGQLTFVADGGAAEPPQWLLMDKAIYACRTMAVAASAQFRVTRAVTATVRAWARLGAWSP
jgi:hypothetical protein